MLYPMKQSILSTILAEGEGYYIEFKERVANLDREIVAFANASGGSIFIGVKDDHQVIGVSLTNRLKSEVVDIARNCDPSIKIELISHREEKILEVKVFEGSDKPYRCRDGFFLRVGPNAQKLTRDEILKLISESGKLHFDEAINSRFDFKKDLCSEKIERFLHYCGINQKLSHDDVLQSLNVAKIVEGQLVMTNAGVLFFSKRPEFFFPEANITAVCYRSQDRFSIIDKKDFYGSPFEQIESALAFIMRHMNVEASIRLFAARQDLYDYPLAALREAVINAVAHRDYQYDGSHIYIHMYPDRIDIESPGGLYLGLTVENLGTRSVRRNRLIADLLHRARFIEKVGSGFDRMRQSLSENNNPPLEVSATNFFNIRFYKRISTGLALSLTSRQLTIYQLFQEKKELTRSQIASILGASNDTIIRDLNELVKQKHIQRKGVGKAVVYTLTSIT